MTARAALIVTLTLPLSLALAGIPASPNIVFQTAAQNTLVISDLPGPTGGIMP